MNIYAEDVANSHLQDVTQCFVPRKTTDFVNWKDAPAWTVEHAAGPDQQTPNVASLVQEIVNKDGWVEGNTLGFILTGQGTRTAESFEGAGTMQTKFHNSMSSTKKQIRRIRVTAAEITAAERHSG